MTNAKEKLQQLQDLIAKLQHVSSNNTAEASPGLTSKQLHDVQQKEAAKALDVLNEIEKQKAEEKLNELKQNKERLLRLLKEKETESEILTRLYSSHTNQQANSLNSSKLKAALFNSSSQITNEVTAAGAACFNKSASLSVNGDFEIENKFVSAEGDFDAMSIENINPNQCSPSDLLWSQMKKQLNMRENLRNKKKELEDLIRDVNTNSNNNNTTKSDDDGNLSTLPTQSQMQEFKEKMFNTFIKKSVEKNENSFQMQQTNDIEIIRDDDDKDAESDSSINDESKLSNEDDGYAENNEIINGYREFFMRKKSSNFNSDDVNSYEIEFLNKLKSKQMNLKRKNDPSDYNDEENQQLIK